MNARRFLYALVLILTACLSAAPVKGVDPGFVLAENGRANFSIVTPAKPSPTEEFAAQELQHYLDRMTGARFALALQTTNRFIFVGKRASIPGNIHLPGAVAQLPPEGYSLSAQDGSLALVGADDRAVLYAVYDFLQRLGCRWLAPAFSFYEGANESVPKTGTLRFHLPEPVFEKPVLKYRKLYVEEGRSHTTENLRQLIDWMPKRRFNTLVVPLNYAGGGRVRWDNWRQALTPELQRRAIAIEVGGHGYENYLSATMEGGELFARHPDWFGLDDSGARSQKPHIVFCTSNQEAKQYFTTNVIRYLDAHPEIQIFDFWPPDGAKWCACEACKKLGTPSDRQALLLAEVSAAVHQTRPDLRFETIAYAACVAPPIKSPMDARVLVDFCPINQCFEYQIDDPRSERNAAYVAQLKDWLKTFQGDVSIYSYYRKYAWHSLPTLLPHYMQSDIRFYRDAGVKGISSYSEPGDWGTYELNHYVLGALAWDPNSEVDRLVQEFATARYGSDALLAQKTYQLLEDNVRHLCSLPFTALKSPSQYQSAIDSFQAVESEIATARSHAGDTATAAALKRLGLSLEYARRDMSLQKAKAGKADASQRSAITDETSRFIQKNAQEGVFLSGHPSATTGPAHGVPGQ